LLGLYVRLYVHAFGKWAYLTSIDVPFEKEEWTAYGATLLFQDTNRFTPSMTVATVVMGHIFCLAVLAFVVSAVMITQLVFGGFPYMLSRLTFWFGIATVLDPLATLIEDCARGNTRYGDSFLLYWLFLREEGSGIMGIVLVIALHFSVSCASVIVMYKFWSSFHLNGRVNDLYNRLMFPESGFFLPHDYEISRHDFDILINDTHKWRSDAGEVMKVYTTPWSHPTTCLFRNRLWHLLNSHGAPNWVEHYLQNIKIRHPRKSKFHCNMGNGELASDILDFLDLRFPYATLRSGFRLGDEGSDHYYEKKFIHISSYASQDKRDEVQIRSILLAYFDCQTRGDALPPAQWGTSEETSNQFIVYDAQMVADLIFFETSIPKLRLWYLRSYLKDCIGASYEDPSTAAKSTLPNFERAPTATNTYGKELQGYFVHIYKMRTEMHGLKYKLWRAFVVTPRGAVLEPHPGSVVTLPGWDAEDPDFWAQQLLNHCHPTKPPQAHTKPKQE
jgi:hypothetical protein